MNDPEPVKVGRARHDLRELQVGGKIWGNNERIHQSQMVRPWIRPYVLHHISTGHPLSGNEGTIRAC